MYSWYITAEREVNLPRCLQSCRSLTGDDRIREADSTGSREPSRAGSLWDLEPGTLGLGSGTDRTRRGWAGVCAGVRACVLTDGESSVAWISGGPIALLNQSKVGSSSYSTHSHVQLTLLSGLDSRIVCTCTSWFHSASTRFFPFEQITRRTTSRSSITSQPADHQTASRSMSPCPSFWWSAARMVIC